MSFLMNSKPNQISPFKHRFYSPPPPLTSLSPLRVKKHKVHLNTIESGNPEGIKVHY